MDIAAVMDEVGSALESIPNLRVFPYHAPKVNPPAAVIGWPDTYEFDKTFGRGSDRMVLPVIVVVGKSDTRSARDAMARYAAGSGAHSVKAAIESFEFESFDSARVTSVEFGVLVIAAVSYLAATFDIEIQGQGV